MGSVKVHPEIDFTCVKIILLSIVLHNVFHTCDFNI